MPSGASSSSKTGYAAVLLPDMPTISVVVPLYNKARYIARCLDSILAQSHAHFTLYVINDGSTDSSPQIAASYSDPRLNLVNQPNAGPGSARNHGLRLAQSDYVAFLDGDDAWHPDFLARTLAHLETHPVAALNWGMQIFPQNITTEERWRRLHVPHGLFRLTPHSPTQQLVAILANTLPSSCVLHRQTALHHGGFYDHDRCLFSEDAHLYLKLLLHDDFYFDPAPLTLRYEDASELALNQGGVRPIEPFLRDPEDIFHDCPAPFRPLVDRFLAARALKTAAVYGYFGHPGQARALFARFVRPTRDFSHPHFFPALLSHTPIAGFLGRLHAAVKQ